MNKRKERSEGVEVSCHEQLMGGNFDIYGFGDKRRNLNEYYNGRQLLGFIGDICEKENSVLAPTASLGTENEITEAGVGSETVLGTRSVSGPEVEGRRLQDLESAEEQQSYGQLVKKYESLQNSHTTLQKVVKSLLDKLSQLNELCSQKDRELSEYKVQLKKLVDANETLNMYIQSSHSSIMSNSMINKFGSDIY
ncbi:unnamed protein product [Cryptosporidium hominis]|uniref:Uncharacterized protein n=1 Tax=Cryptosporidium hominis TaxID=237895 RepID=A0A0S4TDX1_CRYHO|nr:hypothetical protein [Cryptosporidium hominis TU502]OLQ16994.1 hypothetical protein ChTU502y2012_389g0275 [Cryptosporidium hominis]PPA62717.1 hypothetical protein ChUKH1_11920 [Cryptosporidium hominis]PPS92897.1 Uncharacterized protein GY17_00002596 [Cryptosporidium hominis]CUV04910.1 unnamed protein product [Cryptosporidium hominis]|eukprot:PPS92897.1 Uncharacterized protein GY17_00002596 [Cryptosporidium hominis]